VNNFRNISPIMNSFYRCLKVITTNNREHIAGFGPRMTNGFW